MSEGGRLREIGEAVFEKEVVESGLPVLVDFFTPPCAPCKALIPILERMAGKFPAVKFVKINAWENQNLCSRFSIRGVPALLFFRKGETVLRMEGSGALDERRIEGALEEMAGSRT